MIEYSLNGAWGNTIPDEKLTEVLNDLGVELKVEARRDGLSNVRIRIDEAKVMRRKKKASSKKAAK